MQIEVYPYTKTLLKVIIKEQQFIGYNNYKFNLGLEDCWKCVQINTNVTLGYCRIVSKIKINFQALIGDLKQKDNQLKYYNQDIHKDSNCDHAFFCRGCYNMDEQKTDQDLSDFRQQ
ncbi:unnamed protein product [Paramecium pentaurelia]|uniref:Uncharacterized protein n=1 Tax=Paramecium pentaurelia TaxID=43138 RepID=A0A8S1Y980_9CILI|nr:unnamed protein product [Paramecium pentaurelia]